MPILPFYEQVICSSHNDLRLKHKNQLVLAFLVFHKRLSDISGDKEEWAQIDKT